MYVVHSSYTVSRTAKTSITYFPNVFVSKSTEFTITSSQKAKAIL